MFGEILLIVFITTALSCLVRGIYETFKLDVSFSIIGKGSKSIKVILFSDLHAKYFNVSIDKIVNVIAKSDADVILFAGDFTNGGSTSEKQKAARIISRIADAASNNKIPFYAVYGNHDIFGTSEMLDGVDIRILSNESVFVYSKDGSRWKILGLEDLKRGLPDYGKANSNSISADNHKRENPAKNDKVKIDEIDTKASSASEIFDCNSKQDSTFKINHGQFVADAKSAYPNRENEHEYLPEIILAHNPDTIFMLPGYEYDNIKSSANSFTDSSSIIPSSISPSVTSSTVSVSNSSQSHSNPVSSIPGSQSITSPLTNKSPVARFILSGHFHGGQIWMPFDLEYKLLRKEKMARLGYRKGAYEYLGFKGYISRGLGCVIVPLRFFSYPEISVLELSAD